MDDDLRANVHNAIAEVMRANGPRMLGPWVLAAATTANDGTREVWVLTGPDTVGYEAKGLVAEAGDRIIEDGLDKAWITDDTDED
jgi:hypothetical protein